MGFGMAGGALLTLGDFEPLLEGSELLLGELEPADEGLAISLTMEDFLCKRRKEYGCKMNEE